MLTRHQFILGGATLAVAPVAACTAAGSADSYEISSKKIHRPITGSQLSELELRPKLIRFTTLAPSSHDAQCWKFHLETNAISILPDFNRRTLMLDPNDNYLFVLLGYALENLAPASLTFGLKSRARFSTKTEDAVDAVKKTTYGGDHGMLDTAPSLAAFKQGVAITRKRGTCVSTGLPHGEFAFPLFDVVLNCITARGSLVGT